MHLLISKQLLMFPETEELTSSESGTRSRATRAPGEHTGKAFASGKGPDGFWAGGNKAEDRWGVQRGAAVSPGDGTEKWRVEMVLGWGL